MVGLFQYELISTFIDFDRSTESFYGLGSLLKLSLTQDYKTYSSMVNQSNSNTWAQSLPHPTQPDKQTTTSAFLSPSEST